MFQQNNEGEENFNNQNPVVDLYKMCKSVSSDTWLSTPSLDDTWFTSSSSTNENSSSNTSKSTDNTDPSYFTAFFFDYHHELQQQQKQLKQKLQQLQLLEQLIQPGNSVSQLPEENNDGNTEVSYEDSNTKPQTPPCPNPDLGNWILNSNLSKASSTESCPADINATTEYNWVTSTQPNLPAAMLNSEQTLDDMPRRTERRTSAPAGSAATNNLHRYICSDCGKGFARASSLRTHRNIHTGDRPFICPFKNCGKSFNARSNMLRHHKLHFKTDRGLYMLPNGEITSVKPSSRKLFALSKQQHQKFTALPAVYMNAC